MRGIGAQLGAKDNEAGCEMRPMRPIADAQLFQLALPEINELLLVMAKGKGHTSNRELEQHTMGLFKSRRNKIIVQYYPRWLH